MTRRASTNDAYAPPVNVSELNTPGQDFPSWISPDNCRLYFSSSSTTSSTAVSRIYVAERPHS